jgi:hypothetical protein
LKCRKAAWGTAPLAGGYPVVNVIAKIILAVLVIASAMRPANIGQTKPRD